MSDIKELSTYELLKELKRRRDVCMYWVCKEDMLDRAKELCCEYNEWAETMDLTDEDWEKYWDKFIDNIEREMDLDEVMYKFQDAFIDLVKDELDIE